MFNSEVFKAEGLMTEGCVIDLHDFMAATLGKTLFNALLQSVEGLTKAVDKFLTPLG